MHKKCGMNNTQLNVLCVEVCRRYLWSDHLACLLVTGTVVSLRNKSDCKFISVSRLLWLPERKLVCSVSFPRMTEILPYCYCFNMITFPVLCWFLHPPLPSAGDPVPSQHVHTDSWFSIQHNWGGGNLHRGCEKCCWQKRMALSGVDPPSTCSWRALALPPRSFPPCIYAECKTNCVPLL